MRVDRAELPPGGNRALELTEKGQAPWSPHGLLPKHRARV